MSSNPSKKRIEKPNQHSPLHQHDHNVLRQSKIDEDSSVEQELMASKVSAHQSSNQIAQQQYQHVQQLSKPIPWSTGYSLPTMQVPLRSALNPHNPRDGNGTPLAAQSRTSALEASVLEQELILRREQVTEQLKLISTLQEYLNLAYREIENLKMYINRHNGGDGEARNVDGLYSQIPPSTGMKDRTRYWTDAEHLRFLESIEKFGPKDVKQISQFVQTRDATQVRTHTQKYFQRLLRMRDPSVASKSFKDLSNILGKEISMGYTMGRLASEDATIYCAERVLDKRSKKGAIEYFVKWENHGIQEATWVLKSNIVSQALILYLEKMICQVAEYETYDSEERNMNSIHTLLAGYEGIPKEWRSFEGNPDGSFVQVFPRSFKQVNQVNHEHTQDLEKVNSQEQLRGKYRSKKRGHSARDSEVEDIEESSKGRKKRR